MKIPGVKLALPVTVLVNGVQVPISEVRFEGQPVAAVAATTPEIAEDAARAIVVKYERLPHVVTADDAMKPGAPAVVTGGLGGGARGRGGGAGGTPEAADAALATCDAVIEAEYRSPILHHACLETHCAMADYNGGPTATVYALDAERRKHRQRRGAGTSGRSGDGDCLQHGRGIWVQG